MPSTDDRSAGRPARRLVGLTATRARLWLRPRWVGVASVIAAALATTMVATTTAGFTDTERGAWPLTTGSFDPPPPPVVTLNASEDTHIRSNSAGSNYGTSNVLQVFGRTGPENHRTLIRFGDLPEVPAGYQVTGATLRLYQNRATQNSRTFDAHLARQSWVESGTGGVTWNNAGQNAAASGTVNGWTPRASITGTNNTGWKMWTVTDHVRAWINDDHPNYGFLIKDRTESDGGVSSDTHAQFRSREYTTTTQRPELVITIGPA